MVVVELMEHLPNVFIQTGNREGVSLGMRRDDRRAILTRNLLEVFVQGSLQKLADFSWMRPMQRNFPVQARMMMIGGG